MEEITNPLRAMKRQLPNQSKPTSSVSTPAQPLAAAQVPVQPSATAATAQIVSAKETSFEASNQPEKGWPMPNIMQASDDLDPAIKAALELLASKGIAVQDKKKIFVKHTYELEENLYKEFHEMYGVLGFKTVKEAVNEVFSNWCLKNREEFNRRKGNS